MGYVGDISVMYANQKISPCTEIWMLLDIPGPIPLWASHTYTPASDSSIRENIIEPFDAVDHWPSLRIVSRSSEPKTRNIRV